MHAFARRLALVVLATAALLAACSFVIERPLFAQTPLPPPGKIGDITYNNVTVQESLTVLGTMNLQSSLNYGVDAGSNDTYVATISPAPTAYVAGALYILKAATANTGAASINLNGLGAKTIVKAVNTTLSNNDILAAMYCLMVYDGTNMVLLNPRAL